MNLEGRTRRTLFSLLSIVAFILVSCGAKAESALPAATATLPPTFTPTLPSLPLSTPTSSEHCVTIAYPQPRNAFRAWLALNQPGELEFQNLAGPDGDGSKTRINRQTLPELVHIGDKFCAPGQ